MERWIGYITSHQFFVQILRMLFAETGATDHWSFVTHRLLCMNGYSDFPIIIDSPCSTLLKTAKSQLYFPSKATQLPFQGYPSAMLTESGGRTSEPGKRSSCTHWRENPLVSLQFEVPPWGWGRCQPERSHDLQRTCSIILARKTVAYNSAIMIWSP